MSVRCLMTPVTLLLLSAIAFAPRAARADLIYTWHEDDGQDVTGQLILKNSAQAAGGFGLSDIISFTFTAALAVEPFSLNKDSLFDGYFPMPLSTVTAIPTASNSFFDAGGSVYPQYDESMSVDFNNLFGASGSQQWRRYTPVLLINQNGFGHWTLFDTTAVAAVPEPGSLTLVGLGAAGLAAGALRRRRRAAA